MTKNQTPTFEERIEQEAEKRYALIKNQNIFTSGSNFAHSIDWESKWISVEDRLPEIDKNVLLFYTIKEYEYFEIGQLESITITSANKQSSIFRDKNWEYIAPTHWMLLPEPPKTDKP